MSSYKKELKRYVAGCYDILETEQLIIEECTFCIEDLDLQKETLDWGIHDGITARREEIIEARLRINYKQIKSCMQRIRVEKKLIRKTKKQISKL